MKDKPVFPPYITLIADASYCHETRAYGWCYWIKHGKPPVTIVKSGGGVGDCKSSGEAEVQALLEGLEIIRSFGTEYLTGQYVVIQSDCTEALMRIAPVLEALKKLGAKRAYTKHVPGHKGNISPRNAVNALCDRYAGNEMRRRRDEIKKVL